MSQDRTRLVLAIVAAAATGAFMIWGVHGLAPFGQYPGPYGDILNHVATMQRHVLNVATAINFDYRGFDTLGEEYILFTAVAGVALLFREQLGSHERVSKDPDTERERGAQSDGIGWMGYGWVPFGAMFAAYIAVHGTLTPGGGFQAGAIAASVYALVYFGQDFLSAMRFVPLERADALEALGAGAYGLVGTATAIASGFYLANVLPLGKTGDMLSGGTIAVINFCVFIEVTFGLIVCIEFFLKQTRKTEGAE